MEPKPQTLEELGEQIAKADASKKSAIEQLDDRREEVEIEAASDTRAAKSTELARRVHLAGRARLARDTTELPDEAGLENKPARTMFALLKSTTPTPFNEYVGEVLQMIEAYGGDILDVKWGLEKSTHFVALTFSMPSELSDIVPAAIRHLKKLNKA